MIPTSASLLIRLRHANPESPHWKELHNIYVPFIRGCLRWSPSLTPHVDDIVQEVFLVLIQKLPHFQRNRDGSFRTWLRCITVNQVRAWRRKNPVKTEVKSERNQVDLAVDFLAQLEDPSGNLARKWDQEHDRHLFAQLIELIKVDFEPTTWEAFRLMTLEGRPARVVATHLKLSEAAVYQSNSRVRRRLRQEAAGLVPCPD